MAAAVSARLGSQVGWMGVEMARGFRRRPGASSDQSGLYGPGGSTSGAPKPAVQVSLSKPSSFTAGKAAAARAPVARAVTCSAEKQEASRQVATGVAAAAMALTFGFGAVDAAYADVAGLTPCSESKAFAKRKKNEVGSCAGSRQPVAGGQNGLLHQTCCGLAGVPHAWRQASQRPRQYGGDRGSRLTEPLLKPLLVCRSRLWRSACAA